MPEPQLVRPATFAGMCGVTKACVSKWMLSGKIHGPAIVEQLNGRMIDPDVARAQLRETLDVDKRFGLKGLSTRLDDPQDRLPLEGGGGGSVESQIKAEKLRHAQLMTSRLEEEDRARRGVYIEAATARAEITRAVSDLLIAFEGALPDFASAVAAKFQVPQRDALHLLRKEFRRMRERAAAVHAKAAAAAPRTVEAIEPQPDGMQ